MTSQSSTQNKGGRPRNADKLLHSQKIAELYRRGILVFKLHSTQMEMYNRIKGSTSQKYVINSSRRIGKSWLLCVIALEQAYQKRGSQIRFMCPTQRMVKKIMTPTFRQLLADCPANLKPKFNQQDGVWKFPNGSEIHICGSEQGQVDGLRGTAADLIIVDEAGFCSDLEYALESVLIPQTLTVPDARIILASTPPISPDHKFVEYCRRAIEEKAYAKFTIYDNPMLAPETIEKFKFEAGGENTTTWRREYLAEFVTDTSMAILPEATEELLAAITKPVTPPKFFIPFTAIDLGYVDQTGILFGYYDFPEAKICIQDEILINKCTSQDIVNLVMAKEKELWGDIQPTSRVVDGNPMQIADMNRVHRFRCHAPEKSDLHANVNRVRMDLTEMRVLIDPRCEQLIEQMKFGTWDSSKKSFQRTSKGHYDLLAALVYFLKHANRNTNPCPPGYGWDPHNSWGIPTTHPNSAQEQMKRLFPFLRRKNV